MPDPTSTTPAEPDPRTHPAPPDVGRRPGALPLPAAPASGWCADEAPVQRTAGRWVILRPIRPVDYDVIRLAELSDDLGVRWRHGGATPSPEAFAHALWAGVLVQYLVVTTTEGRLVGLVSAYDVDLRSGTCHVGFARFSPDERGPGLVEGILLLADHLFAHWPLRKLYGETLEFNRANLGATLGPLLVEEGRLRQHAFAGGRYWDLIQLALYRDTWVRHRDRLLPLRRETGPEAGAAPVVVSVHVPGTAR